MLNGLPSLTHDHLKNLGSTNNKLTCGAFIFINYLQTFASYSDDKTEKKRSSTKTDLCHQ